MQGPQSIKVSSFYDILTSRAQKSLLGSKRCRPRVLKKNHLAGFINASRDNYGSTDIREVAKRDDGTE